MGASCCGMTRDDKYRSKPGNYMSEEWISSHHLEAAGIRAPSTNGIRNPRLPSGKDEENVQTMIERRLMRPHNYHTVLPQHQQLGAANSMANADQADETVIVLKSEMGKSIYPACALEKADDPFKECKKNDLDFPPESEEEDFCSICLEGYDKENPKKLTKCKHHYHLPCILEWMERSNSCPTCEQVLFIDEAYKGQ